MVMINQFLYKLNRLLICWPEVNKCNEEQVLGAFHD